MSERPTPLTRAEAAEQKLTTYFAGKPCPQGHNGMRYTVSSACVQCQRAWNAANKAKVQRQIGGAR